MGLGPAGSQVQLTRFSDELSALVYDWHIDEAQSALPRLLCTTETAHLGFATSRQAGSSVVV